MGLFKNLFKSEKRPELEILLENQYLEKLGQFGITRKVIRNQISKCKTESKQMGADNLPQNYGDYIIEQAKAGSEKHKNIIHKAILGGANESDIKLWWNLSDLERRMIIWEDSIFRITTFTCYQSDGCSFDEAGTKLRKAYPLYGDPSDESNTKGDDRPLPNELHERINRMTAEWAPLYVQQYSKTYNTMNAFIRDELLITEQKN
jgi:hypothetical protein